jgi:hypothetical protein
MSKTNNCSGHGVCYLKFTDKGGKDHKGAPHWACGCNATTVAVGKGVKTTYWGGPACQKKDISIPFFLLAGFSVMIFTVVVGAIGMLYSMGQEPLPSVLGAGVAVSRPK